MAILTKKQILEANNIKPVAIHIPAWGGEVLLRPMTAAARDKYEASFINPDGTPKKNALENVRARLVMAHAVDEKGDPLFTEKDLVALGKKDAASMDILFTECQKLSRISDDDIESLSKN